jgi:hypothetical protein
MVIELSKMARKTDSDDRTAWANQITRKPKRPEVTRLKIARASRWADQVFDASPGRTCMVEWSENRRKVVESQRQVRDTTSKRVSYEQNPRKPKIAHPSTYQQRIDRTATGSKRLLKRTDSLLPRRFQAPLCFAWEQTTINSRTGRLITPKTRAER